MMAWIVLQAGTRTWFLAVNAKVQTRHVSKQVVHNELERKSEKAPTHNSTHNCILLHPSRTYSHCFQEFSLRSPGFVAVFLSVEIRRRLNS